MQNNYSNPSSLVQDPAVVSSIMPAGYAGAALADQEKYFDYLRNEDAKRQAMERFRAEQEMPSLVSGYALKNNQNQFANDPSRIEQSFQSGIGPGMNAYQQSEATRQGMPYDIGNKRLGYENAQATQESGNVATNAANREKAGASNEAGQMRGYRNLITDLEPILNEGWDSSPGSVPSVGQMQKHTQRWMSAVDKAVKAGHISADEGDNLKNNYSPETKDQMRQIMAALKDRVQNWEQSNKLEQIRETGKETRLTEKTKGWWDAKAAEITAQYALMMKSMSADTKMNPGQMIVSLMRNDPELSKLTAREQVDFLAQVVAAQSNVGALGLDALQPTDQRAQSRAAVSPKLPQPQPGAVPQPPVPQGPPGASMQQQGPAFPNAMQNIPPEMMPPGMGAGGPPQMPQGPRMPPPQGPQMQAPPMQPPQVDPRSPTGVQPMGVPTPPPPAPVARKGVVNTPDQMAKEAMAKYGPALAKQGAKIIGIDKDGKILVEDSKGKRFHLIPNK